MIAKIVFEPRLQTNPSRSVWRRELNAAGGCRGGSASQIIRRRFDRREATERFQPERLRKKIPAQNAGANKLDHLTGVRVDLSTTRYAGYSPFVLMRL